MTELSDQVRASFQHAREHNVGDDEDPVQFIAAPDKDVPGLAAMREYYGVKLLVVTRRGYRQFAGATMPTDADELVERTSKEMLTWIVALMLRAFSDGVLIGQRNELIVQMALHYNTLPELFSDEEFRTMANTMAVGFSDDPDVLGYLGEYLESALAHMTHVTGFAHSQVNPAKIWDIWTLTGTSVVSSTFLAGERLGTSWRERDVLTGIEIATEEGTHELEGEDGPVGRGDEADQG